jgi:predicted MFS family arabinose efflux permease
MSHWDKSVGAYARIMLFVFSKIRVSGICVFDNLCTVLLTFTLLLIRSGPATTAAFAAFVTVLYGGFPFTVFSQLTTGPMLDVLAPIDKIGYIQGLNNLAVNFGIALALCLFGVLADATTTDTAIWTGISISFLAAPLNAPLMWIPEMGPPEKRPTAEEHVLPGEDAEVEKKARIAITSI